MTHRILAVSAALIFASGGIGEVQAQETELRSRVQGLSVGLHSTSTALTLVDDGSTSYGGGLGLRIGYGISSRIAVHSLTTGSFMVPKGGEEYLLTHVDLEGRYAFGNRESAWVPHVALGATARTGSFLGSGEGVDEPTRQTTIGLTAGGGISFHLTPSTSLDGSLRYTFGNLEEPTCPSGLDSVRTCATSTRVSFGISWFPFAR